MSDGPKIVISLTLEQYNAAKAIATEAARNRGALGSGGGRADTWYEPSEQEIADAATGRTNTYEFDRR